MIFSELSIKQRKAYLQSVVKAKKKELTKLPSGLVKATPHGKGFQYYHRMRGDDKNGRYVRKEDFEKVCLMVQHEYNEQVVDAATEELKVLDKLERIYNNHRAEDVYSMLPLGKQILLTPIRETDEQFLNRILSIEYEKLSFSDDYPEFYSNNNERMRSKSEVIIANLLDKLKIPYLYEMPLVLNRATVHPDFTLIDVVNRRLIYLEHLGMLDDPDYMNTTILKIRDYENSGFFLGESLIITGETAQKPLDIKLLEKKILYVMRRI